MITNSFAHYSFLHPIPAVFNFLLPEVVPFWITFNEGLWVSDSLICSYLFHPHLWIKVKKKKKKKQLLTSRTDLTSLLGLILWQTVLMPTVKPCSLIECKQSHRNYSDKSLYNTENTKHPSLLLNEWWQLLSQLQFILTLIFPSYR